MRKGDGSVTYAVHNLHTPAVEVIENGAARFYRVSSTGADLPLGQFIGELHETREAAEAWRLERLKEFG